MPKFQKRPVVIEAEQYLEDGDSYMPGICHLSCQPFDGDFDAHVHTIHDNQPVLLQYGDWIVPEPDGIHFYPVKPDIFAATYDAAEG